MTASPSRRPLCSPSRHRRFRRAATAALLSTVAAPVVFGVGPASAQDPAPASVPGFWTAPGGGYDLTIKGVGRGAFPSWVSFGGTRPASPYVPAPNKKDPADFSAGLELAYSQTVAGLPNPTTSPYYDGGQLTEAFCIELGKSFPHNPNVPLNPVAASQATAVLDTPDMPRAARVGRAGWIAANYHLVGTPIGTNTAFNTEIMAAAADGAAAQLAIWSVANGVDPSADLGEASSFPELVTRAKELVSLSAPHTTPPTPVSYTLEATPVSGAGQSVINVQLKSGSGAPVASQDVVVSVSGMPAQKVKTDEAGKASTASFATPVASTPVSASFSTVSTVASGTVLEAAGSAPDGQPFQHLVTTVPAPVTLSASVQAAVGEAPAPSTTTSVPPSSAPTTVPPSSPPSSTPPPSSPQKLPYTGGWVDGPVLVLALLAGAGGLVVLVRARLKSLRGA